MKKHYGPMLRLLHSCMDQSVSAALESMDLTSSQGHILGYLAHCATPPCLRDLEKAFGLSHPTVTGLVQRLEKKGFIRLEPDPNDRRSKRIYSLPRAVECHEIIRRTIEENEHQLVQGFTEQEQMMFRQLLERALTNMGCPPGAKICKEEPKK